MLEAAQNTTSSVAAAGETPSTVACTKCGSQLERTKGIEVGHSFLLGDKYSAPFSAVAQPEPGSKPSVLQMGCYGLGVTRILGRTASYTPSAS